jgi:hypothetical protein
MNRFRIGSLSLALAAGLLLATSGVARAHCSHSSSEVSQADKDWWAVHGCQSSFYNYHYKAYHINDGDSWVGHGFDDACSVRMEYPKLWSAAYLVNYGLSDNNSYCFHFSQSDYKPLAEGYSSNFHNSTEYWVATSLPNGAFGGWSWNCCDADDVTLGCPLFTNSLNVNANPASRAGDFMHEGWHGYEDKHGYGLGSTYGGHRASAGSCSINSCDYWHWHTISKYAPGQLYQNKTNGNPSHRPNQVQVEFLCDVNQYPTANVPASVRLAAKADADTRAVQRFINGPGYKCGDPRPW